MDEFCHFNIIQSLEETLDEMVAGSFIRKELKDLICREALKATANEFIANNVASTDIDFTGNLCYYKYNQSHWVFYLSDPVIKYTDSFIANSQYIDDDIEPARIEAHKGYLKLVAITPEYLSAKD